MKTLKADFFGIEILHYTRHFSKKSIELGKKYPRKIDDNGINIITPGVEFYLDKSTNLFKDNIYFIRFTTAYYKDSMNLNAGYLHFGPRISKRYSKKIQLMFGIGPTFYFRETWNRFPEYYEDGFFAENDYYLKGYQYKYLLAGDIDIHYFWSEHVQLVWSIIPGLPDIITNASGIRVRW